MVERPLPDDLILSLRSSIACRDSQIRQLVSLLSVSLNTQASYPNINMYEAQLCQSAYPPGPRPSSDWQKLDHQKYTWFS